MNSPIIILLIEAILVGLYTIVIAFFLSFSFIKGISFFFILGFLKHYLGYITGLQSWYCKKRNVNVNANVKTKERKIQPSLLQNIQEGIAFIILSFLIKKYLKIKDFKISILYE